MLSNVFVFPCVHVFEKERNLATNFSQKTGNASNHVMRALLVFPFFHVCIFSGVSLRGSHIAEGST